MALGRGADVSIKILCPNLNKRQVGFGQLERDHDSWNERAIYREQMIIIFIDPHDAKAIYYGEKNQWENWCVPLFRHTGFLLPRTTVPLTLWHFTMSERVQHAENARKKFAQQRGRTVDLRVISTTL